MDISKDHFSVPIQIRMSDLDPFNHVNNGAQCSYFDLGRSAYIEKIIGEKIDWLKIDLVLAHISIDFLAPILYTDTISCACKVTHLGHKSFKMTQYLFDPFNYSLKTKSESVIVGIDRETLETIPISEQYREKLKLFEKQYDQNI